MTPLSPQKKRLLLSFVYFYISKKIPSKCYSDFILLGSFRGNFRGLGWSRHNYRHHSRCVTPDDKGTRFPGHISCIRTQRQQYHVTGGPTTTYYDPTPPTPSYQPTPLYHQSWRLPCGTASLQLI